MRPAPHLAAAAGLAGALAFLAVAPTLASRPEVARPTPPRPPRVLLDTSYTTPKGRTIAVRAGGDFQGALEAARPGDVITLEAGAVFRGTFTLPKKAGDDWIVVRSSAPDASLPPPGTRITPAFAPAMATLVTPNPAQVVQTAPGARRYRFIGIEFTVAPNVRTIRQIVAFGGLQSTLTDTPSDLVLDRCYVHGQPQGNVFRGVLLNSASSAVVDSHISEIHVAGHDSQAILGYNGPGPFKIVNNYLEAAGENIMFGGGEPRIPGLVPSDIEIRRNHLFKPLRWRRGEPDFVGIQWTVKNLLELKNAQRVLIEGNVLENAWAESQGGAALVLTPRNSGTAPWTVVQDVLFRNNLVRNAEGAFGGQSINYGRDSQPIRRLAIVNNLGLAISRTFFTMAIPGVPLEDFIVDHNTAVPTRQFSYDIDGVGPPAFVRFQFTNNMTGFGVYGVKFPRTTATTVEWFPHALIAGNVLIRLGEVDGRHIKRPVGPWELRSDMFTVFPDAESVGLQPDGRLTADSPLRGTGTDRRDIGVNFAELQRALWTADLRGWR